MYEEKAVEDFARMHIGYWHKKAIIVPCKLIWGFEAIDVEMYEFHPRDEVIRHSVLGVTDWDNNKAAIEKMRSPPLGLSMIDRQDLHKFNEEIDDIVNNWLHLFVERFYPKKEDDFAPSLLRLMAEFCRSPAEEVCHTPTSSAVENPVSRSLSPPSHPLLKLTQSRLNSFATSSASSS